MINTIQAREDINQINWINALQEEAIKETNNTKETVKDFEETEKKIQQLMDRRSFPKWLLVRPPKLSSDDGSVSNAEQIRKWEEKVKENNKTNTGTSDPLKISSDDRSISNEKQITKIESDIQRNKRLYEEKTKKRYEEKKEIELSKNTQHHEQKISWEEIENKESNNIKPPYLKEDFYQEQREKFNISNKKDVEETTNFEVENSGLQESNKILKYNANYINETPLPELIQDFSKLSKEDMANIFFREKLHNTQNNRVPNYYEILTRRADFRFDYDLLNDFRQFKSHTKYEDTENEYREVMQQKWYTQENANRYTSFFLKELKNLDRDKKHDSSSWMHFYVNGNIDAKSSFQTKWYLTLDLFKLNINTTKNFLTALKESWYNWQVKYASGRNNSDSVVFHWRTLEDTKKAMKIANEIYKNEITNSGYWIDRSVFKNQESSRSSVLSSIIKYKNFPDKYLEDKWKLNKDFIALFESSKAIERIIYSPEQQIALKECSDINDTKKQEYILQESWFTQLEIDKIIDNINAYRVL